MTRSSLGSWTLTPLEPANITVYPLSVFSYAMSASFNAPLTILDSKWESQCGSLLLNLGQTL